MSEIDEQVLAATNANEELELEMELDNTDDVDTLKEEIEKKNNFARQALARAKKAEAELKALKSTEKAPENQTINNQTLSPDDIDARVLRLQGMSEETLTVLKKVAQATGKSIIDAQQDEIFIALKEKAEREIRESNAKLGTSKGSGAVKKEKTFNTPGLSDADHRAMWKEAQG